MCVRTRVLEHSDVTVTIDQENDDRSDFKKYISFFSDWLLQHFGRHLRSDWLGQHAVQTSEIAYSEAWNHFDHENAVK